MGVSFVSIFILTYHIFFWVCGLAHSLSWDYAPGVPQGEAANTRVSWKEKPIGGFIQRHVLKRRPQSFPDQLHHAYEPQATLPAPVLTQPEVPSLSKRVLAAIAVVVTPISVVVAISLFIALLDPLKGLFVDFEGGPSWEGPDGKPPLAFVIDTGPFFSLHLPLRSTLTVRLTVGSQADRSDDRTNDFVPFGCIIRPDGLQVGPWVWPSGLRPPVGLCCEDDPLAYHRGVRYPGHDNLWSDTPRVEGSNLRRYLCERHTICA